jgi:ornithine decarboxylase
MKRVFRDEVKHELIKDLTTKSIEALLQVHGSPLLLLEPEKIRKQYESLQKSLPMVDHHFAIKALRHPEAVAAVDESGGFFDVMTNSDVDLVKARNIAPERCMHTNPIKKPYDIAYAYLYGLRTFVVDNFAEVDKFIPYAHDIQLLVRLSFRNPEAKSDLSYKFGVAPEEAEKLVAYVQSKGMTVAGFSLHVGSQIHTADAYEKAIKKATELIEKVEMAHNFKMSVFDIGGGFPVDYLEPMPTLGIIEKKITPLLRPLKQRMRILSEPGRFVVAPSMTLFTQVVGKSIRGGQPWYYIDDGIYGSYSNIIFEQVIPHIFALKELQAKQQTLISSVLAGPTCDSVDVITADCALPELEIGDYLVSPMMGAYTWVSATEYNGIDRTPVVVHASTNERL